MIKSTSRLKNYLENYTREKYFTDRIYQIRKDIGIPQNGIKFPKRTPKDYTIELPASILGIRYKENTYPTIPARMTQIYAELISPLPKIYQEFEIILFFNIYILYNERHYEIFEQFWGGTRDTVHLIRLRTEYLEMAGCCDCKVKVCEKYIDFESKKYPIAIGISPYATQNEVISLIKKRWKYIQEYISQLAKDKHIVLDENDKKRLLKVRERQNISIEIEDIVYNNKKLSLSRTGDIVREKTGKILDQGELGKIRSLAIKRRETKNRK